MRICLLAKARRVSKSQLRVLRVSWSSESRKNAHSPRGQSHNRSFHCLCSLQQLQKSPICCICKCPQYSCRFSKFSRTQRSKRRKTIHKCLLHVRPVQRALLQWPQPRKHNQRRDYLQFQIRKLTPRLQNKRFLRLQHLRIMLR